MVSATAWTPWNMIEIATTPGTSTVAKADSAALGMKPVAGGADALADGGEDVEEDENKQERLDDGAEAEDDDVLAQHDEVTPDERPERRPTGGEGRTDPAEADLLAVGDEAGGRGRVGGCDLVRPWGAGLRPDDRAVPPSWGGCGTSTISRAAPFRSAR
jgi:hypothetical protein